MSPNLIPQRGGVPSEVAPAERRTHRRYPVQFDLHYQLSRNQEIVQQGLGKVHDFSDGGVFFTADQNLPEGLDVELTVHWPLRIGGVCPLRMIIFGRVVRSCAEGSAVKITRFELRTRGNQGVPLGEDPNHNGSLIPDPHHPDGTSNR